MPPSDSAPDTRVVPLVGGLLLLGALGALLQLWPARTEAPASCGRPASTSERLRCDGEGESAGARGWLVGQALELNKATAVDLRALPGVGPKTAAAIVAEREARGPFTDVDDLQRTKGIGPKTVTRLRPWLRVTSR
jgi:competence ComEA-like helix-hairpin-helix protein